MISIYEVIRRMSLREQDTLLAQAIRWRVTYGGQYLMIVSSTPSRSLSFGPFDDYDSRTTPRYLPEEPQHLQAAAAEILEAFAALSENSKESV